MNQKNLFAEIKQSYEKIKTADIKTRFNAVKALSHLIKQNYKKENTSKEELELYIEILKLAVKYHGSKYSRLLSKLIGDWLAVTGNDNVEIISKVNGKIESEMSVDAGTAILAIGDLNSIKKLNPNSISEKEHLALINQGKVFVFYAEPNEDSYNVQLRIVNANQPVLSAKEFKNVISSSEIAIIHIPSDTVVVTELQETNREQVIAKIIPGNYKICVYQFHIPTKLDSFYIALAKTDEAANNQLTNITKFE